MRKSVQETKQVRAKRRHIDGKLHMHLALTDVPDILDHGLGLLGEQVGVPELGNKLCFE